MTLTNTCREGPQSKNSRSRYTSTPYSVQVWSSQDIRASARACMTWQLYQLDIRCNGYSYKSSNFRTRIFWLLGNSAELYSNDTTQQRIRGKLSLSWKPVSFCLHAFCILILLLELPSFCQGTMSKMLLTHTATCARNPSTGREMVKSLVFDLSHSFLAHASFLLHFHLKTCISF
jgi:hypothetical protein